MAQTSAEAAAADYWSQQSLWSQAGDRLKRGIGRARTTALFLGITGSVAAVGSSQVMEHSASWGRALAFAAAVALALVPVVSRYSGPAAIRDWTRARSMSEAIKNEIYTFLAGVAPYRGADAHHTLVERMTRLRTDAADLLPRTIGITPVVRGLPSVRDTDSYVEVRIRGQITGYYRPKATEMSRRLGRVRVAEFVLGVCGAVLGAVAGTFEVASVAAWIPVVATVAGAIGAHEAASKYAYQLGEFSRTADELQRLLEARSVQSDKGPAVDDEFVGQCERVISVLNDTWMVKWASD